jgi:hypothetical protein
MNFSKSATELADYLSPKGVHVKKHFLRGKRAKSAQYASQIPSQPPRASAA